jgi:cation:H+ antiporter
MTVILLLVGLGLIVLGADWLVDGASSVARRAGVSEFVIGLTIVGFGTSCPELVVSLTGAIEGNADISVGNVVGSNVFNTLFILGLAALILPVSMTDKNRRRDIPICLAATTILLGLGLTDGLSRWEGILLLLLFSGYLFYCFKTDGGNGEEVSGQKQFPLWQAIGLITLGLAGLIFGGNLFVDNATDLARKLGVSDKFIAVTILAGGTSLPELATSVVAAAKGKDQLALGNILGSNVFNALLILGTASVITPLSFASMTLVDASVLIASALLLLIWAYTGRRNRIDRWEGAVMLLCFIAYYIFLFNRL